MTKKSCKLIWPRAHNWPETTKSDSLQSYLPLMTNSIKKLRNQMILFKEIVDQKILQSYLTRSLTDHTQLKVVVSNATFPWWLTACIKNYDITWFSPKMMIIKESYNLNAWKANLETPNQTTVFSDAAFAWRPTPWKITKIPLDFFQRYW